jgi:signal transduction histidine kinase
VRRALVLDSLVAVAVAVFDLYAIGQPWDDGTRAGSWALNAPLVVLVVLPLALRRTKPRLGLALMMAALALPGIVVAHDYLFWGGFLVLLLMVFEVARTDDGLLGRGAWAVPLVLLPFEGVHVPELRSLSEVAFGLAASVATWGAGRAIRRLDLQEQELGTTLAEVEEQRGAREAAALAGERARIAAEMHDVVAHAVSLMVLQVGAARLEVETSEGPGKVTTQLRAAEAAGRDALDQLRRSLTVMRSRS